MKTYTTKDFTYAGLLVVIAAVFFGYILMNDVGDKKAIRIYENRTAEETRKFVNAQAEKEVAVLVAKRNLVEAQAEKRKAEIAAKEQAKRDNGQTSMEILRNAFGEPTLYVFRTLAKEPGMHLEMTFDENMFLVSSVLVNSNNSYSFDQWPREVLVKFDEGKTKVIQGMLDVPDEIEDGEVPTRLLLVPTRFYLGMTRAKQMRIAVSVTDGLRRWDVPVTFNLKNLLSQIKSLDSSKAKDRESAEKKIESRLVEDKND